MRCSIKSSVDWLAFLTSTFNLFPQYINGILFISVDIILEAGVYVVERLLALSEPGIHIHIPQLHTYPTVILYRGLCTSLQHEP